MGLIKNVMLTLDETDELPWGTFSTEPKQPLPELKFSVDPLAAACASYRIWNSGGARWTELDQVTVTEEDNATADNIRRYYRERLVFEALKKTGSQQVSEFRRKLGLLVDNNLRITKEEIGLLMRLPYFYEEDRDVDNIVSMTSPAPATVQSREISGTFELRKRVLRSRRMGDLYDYWMTSDIDSSAYLLVVKYDNPLRGLVERTLKAPAKLDVVAYTKYMKGYHRGRTIYQIGFV